MTLLVTEIVTEIVTQLVTQQVNHHFLTSDSISDLIITLKPLVLVSLVQSKFLIIVIIVL